MKKSKKLITFLLATLLVMAMLISVVACNPPEDENPTDDTQTDETVTTETLPVSNGYFLSTTGSTYVKNASSWTLTAGSWSKSSTGLTTGVADISAEKFNENKGAINEQIATPSIAPNTPKKDDGSYKDTNALVISMDGDEANGSIFYVSGQVKVEKGKYYKVSIDVWTDLIFNENDANKDTRGANLILSNGTSAGSVEVAKFTSINTSNAWETYTFYIEGSKFEDRNFYVQLWLGYGPSQIRDIVVKGNNTSFESYYTAKGTAMFDNVTMDAIEESEFDAAVVNQYNDITAATATDVNQNMQSIYGVSRSTTVGGNVVLSYVHINNNFTQATGYSTSSTTDTYFTSAKVGTTPNYTIIKGKEDVKDDTEFPSYSSTKDPVGIFDLSKLYYTEKKDGSVVNEYADAYKQINSKFKAPSASKLGISLVDGEYKFSRQDNPSDTKALMVYHQGDAISGAGFQSSNDILIENNKYYAVSVWVFIWVPEYTKEEFCGTLDEEPIAPTDTEAADYETKYEAWEKEHATWVKEKETYDAKVETWEKLNGFATGVNDVKATLRLQGASTDEKAEVQTDGTWGTWQNITIKVKGNQLADRKVNLELWYGEGEWGSDTLYPGGCIFDNITIKEYATEEAINAEYANGEIKKWDTIELENYEGFGLHNAQTTFTALAKEGENESGWYYNVVDQNTFVNMSSQDSNLYAGILSGSAVANWETATAGINALQNIAKPETVFSLDAVTFDYVILNHANYTASKVAFKPEASSKLLKTEPNHFYRLSMWVNTQNLKSGSTFKVSLYDAETDAVINSSAAQTSLAVSEWTELSFVMQSSATESDTMYILVEFGSGDIYTPASHASGAIMISAITWTDIAYTEYSSAKGTYVKSFDLSSSTSTGSSISNSDFSQVANGNYDLDEDDDEVFNTAGEIIGVADPKNWSKATEAYVLSAPSFVTKEVEKLTWKHTIEEVTHYFIYNKDKELVKVIDASDTASYTEETAGDPLTRTYEYTPTTKDNYYVRAVSYIDTNGDSVNEIYCSNLSSAHDATSIATVGTAESVISDNAIENALNSIKSGIVNAKTYNSVGLGDDFYGTASNELLYNSALSSNLLMISSDYNTYIGYTNSSSASLSTESFYRLSVWVKTIGDATASVTIKNSSNYLSVTATDPDAGEYVGYTGINTADKWVRYDFYIATNLSSGSLTLEMYLGNKYANNTLALSEDGTKVSSGTSKGTVYFDDVMLVKLQDEAAYNKLVYGVENVDEIDNAELKELLTKYGYDVNQENADISVQNLLKVRKAYVKDNAITLLSENDATATYFANTFKYELVNYNKDSFDNYDKKTDSDANKFLGNESNSFTHYNSNSVYNNSGSGNSEVSDDDHPNHAYGVFSKNDVNTDLVAHMVSTDYLVSGDYALANAFTEAQITSFLSNTYSASHPNYAGNNNYLMMANITKPSTQSYQTSSLSMAATSYYKITFYAKYLAVDANKKPEFRFIYNNSDKYWQTIQIQPSEEMVEYTFYYANESSKSLSAYLAFFLGSKDAQGEAEAVENFMNGILIVDDLSIVKLASKEEYDAQKLATESDTANEGRYNSYLTEATDDTTDEKPAEDTEEEEEEPEKQINPQVWLIISSVVIGLILVAVIVVMIYRKLKTKVVKKLRKTKVDSNMPADFEKKQAVEKVRKNSDSKKKDISLDDYND